MAISWWRYISFSLFCTSLLVAYSFSHFIFFNFSIKLASLMLVGTKRWWKVQVKENDYDAPNYHLDCFFIFDFTVNVNKVMHLLLTLNVGWKCKPCDWTLIENESTIIIGVCTSGMASSLLFTSLSLIETWRFPFQYMCTMSYTLYFNLKTLTWF